MSPEIDISGGIVFYKNRIFVLLHRFGVSRGSRETLKAEFGWGVAAALAAAGEEEEAGRWNPSNHVPSPWIRGPSGRLTPAPQVASPLWLGPATARCILAPLRASLGQFAASPFLGGLWESGGRGQYRRWGLGEVPPFSGRWLSELQEDRLRGLLPSPDSDPWTVLPRLLSR